MLVRLLVLLVAVASFSAHAQYAITWWTIDGGGGTSADSVYQVRGTIGQPDCARAHARVLAQDALL